MRSTVAVVALFLTLTSTAFSQGKSVSGASGPRVKELALPAASRPEDIAKATFAAHGGEKLKKLTSLLMKGSVDLSVFNQSMPGAFSTAISGDKYFFEIVSAVQQLKQVFDGQNTYSSLQGFSLPPVTRPKMARRRLRPGRPSAG